MELTHLRLLVDEFAACFRFHRDVLGYEPTFGDASTGYADFDTGDVTLALFDRAEMADAVPLRDHGDGAMLVLRVDDVDDAVDRLRPDAPVVAEPEDHPEWGIRTAHVRDPDGTLVEVNEAL